MNKYFIVLIAVSLFFSCGKESPVPVSPKSLKIMTLNVWSGLDYIGTMKMGEYESPSVREKRYQALLKEIKRIAPDIIGVNEANFLPDYIERLAEDIDYDFIYHVGISGVRVSRVGLPWNLKEGDALLVRRGLQLKEAGRKQLSGGPVCNHASFHLEDATQVLVGKITLDKKEVYLAVTHLHASPPDIPAFRKKMKEYKKQYGYSEQEYRDGIADVAANTEWRKKEATTLVTYLKGLVPPGAPLILMGDFNAESDWPAMKIIFNSGYRDTVKTKRDGQFYTWDNEKNFNVKKYYRYNLDKKYSSLYDHMDKYLTLSRTRIDFILVNNGISDTSVTAAGLCGDKKYFDVHPSDHFGVWAALNIDEGK